MRPRRLFELIKTELTVMEELREKQKIPPIWALSKRERKLVTDYDAFNRKGEDFYSRNINTVSSDHRVTNIGL